MDRHFPVKYFLFIAVVLAGTAAASLFFLKTASRPATEANPQAVGLRGTSRVTKEISPVQRKKLERNFLETPPALAASGGNSSVRAQVDSINKFNQRQTR